MDRWKIIEAQQRPPHVGKSDRVLLAGLNIWVKENPNPADLDNLWLWRLVASSGKVIGFGGSPSRGSAIGEARHIREWANKPWELVDAQGV